MCEPGRQFLELSDAPDPKLMHMPKGTLPPRHMTSRGIEGQYYPEGVVVPTMQYQAPDRNPYHVVSRAFFTRQNRRRIVDEVVSKLRQLGHAITAEELPKQLVNDAMHEANEVFAMNAANAPHAMTGPSENMRSLAPPDKYHMDFSPLNPRDEHERDIARLNTYTGTVLLDGILSEQAMHDRFYKDMGGAIHVLQYPSRPGPELRKGTQLNFRYYDDITPDRDYGLYGNNLRGCAQNSTPR